MSDLIETSPEILGGKPIIKGTRIPVALIYELIGLKYSIDQILEEYPHLKRNIILKILEIRKDAHEYLTNRDIDEVLWKINITFPNFDMSYLTPEKIVFDYSNKIINRDLTITYLIVKLFLILNHQQEI